MTNRNPEVQDRFSLTGKTALITGGGGLLGPEHAIALAKSGASVVLVDVNDQYLENGKKRILKEVPKANIRLSNVDICSEEKLVCLKMDLAQENLVVDILVNNAALNPKMDQSGDFPSGAVETYNVADWNKEIEIGITGTFLCCKVFGGEMASRGSGIIINIASDLAVIAPDHRIYSETGVMEDVKSFKPIGYSVVKTAMLGLNKYLAAYWAHKGVRVNCLVPGSVLNNQSPKLVHNIEDRVPLRRLAEISEYREAILFLASEASSYMTGQMLVMDGGRSIW